MQFLNQLQAELKIGFWCVWFLSYVELLPDFQLQSETCLGSESQSQIIEKADQKARSALSNIGSIGSEELNLWQRRAVGVLFY